MGTKKPPRLQMLKPRVAELPSNLRVLGSWRAGKTKTAERGYGGRWQRERAEFLKKHPLCVMCHDQGRTTAATVVDHRIPHEGDERLFWDRANWQPLCATCHSSHKQREEKSGTVRQQIGPAGWPVQPVPAGGKGGKP